MTKNKVLTLVVTLLASIAMAGSALAQQDSEPDSGAMQHGPMMDQKGGSMGGGMMMGHHGMRRGMGMGGSHGYLCGRMIAHVEGRLAFLKAELKITPEQESMWNDYARAVRDNTKSIGERCATMTKQGEAGEQSLPGRLDAQEQFVAARLDALRAVSKSLKPLYAALSDEQKKLADQFIRSSTGMM
jgi:hypothetical protein